MGFRPVRAATGGAALAMTVIAGIILLNYAILFVGAEREDDRQRETAFQDITLFNEEIQTFAARLDWLSSEFRNTQISYMQTASSHANNAREAWLDSNFTGVANELRQGRSELLRVAPDPYDTQAGYGEPAVEPDFPVSDFILASLFGVILWGILMGLSPTRSVELKVRGQPSPAPGPTPSVPAPSGGLGLRQRIRTTQKRPDAASDPSEAPGEDAGKKGRGDA